MTLKSKDNSIDLAHNSSESIINSPSVSENVNIDSEIKDINSESNVSFDDFDLPLSLKKSLNRMKFTLPTPIQAKSIPIALEGKDILGTAQTGTGKTAAYAIPIITKLSNDPNAAALILTPTRELAAQVIEVIRNLIGDNVKGSLKCALLIGGDSMHKQLMQLNSRPKVIVGTPGRVNDHLKRGSLNLTKTNTLVLDETDRMLDMGFGIQIDEILTYINKDKQTLMFSATLPKQILKLAEKYQRNPVRVAVGSLNAPASQIKQEIIKTQHSNLQTELLKHLDKCEGSIIVFVNTKFGADKLADKLCDIGYDAQAIHGDLQQRKRQRVITSFKTKKTKILVATDVAARGLDVPTVELVVNFGLPQAPEDYIHRIGRTARAGMSGLAVSLITPDENRKWRAIEQLLANNEPDNDFKSGKSGSKQFAGRNRFGDSNKAGRSRFSSGKKQFGFGNSDTSSKQGFGRIRESRSDDNRFKSSSNFSASRGNRMDSASDKRYVSENENRSRPSSFNRFESKNRSDSYHQSDSKNRFKSDTRSSFSKRREENTNGDFSSRYNTNDKPFKDFNSSKKPSRFDKVVDFKEYKSYGRNGKNNDHYNDDNSFNSLKRKSHRSEVRFDDGQKKSFKGKSDFKNSKPSNKFFGKGKSNGKSTQAKPFDSTKSREILRRKTA